MTKRIKLWYTPQKANYIESATEPDAVCAQIADSVTS